MRAIENYAADERWDWWVCLGDLIDNEAISSFNDGKPRRVMTAPTVKEQFDYANTFLDRHLSAVRVKNPSCQCVLIEGNHEERTERYVDRMPELQGMLDVEHALRLKERHVSYVRFWSKGELYRIGKAYFGHGASTGVYHAAKHARDFMCNLYYGHAHDVQSHTIKRRSDQSTIEAKSLGCLAEFGQPYMRGRPHNWVHAFAVFQFFPDGSFQENTVKCFKDKFVGPSNGKVYQG